MLRDPMEPKQIAERRRERRRRKLQQIVEELARKHGLPDQKGAKKLLSELADTQASHVSALLREDGDRKIGPELQARFEQIAEKPEGWFDLPDQELPTVFADGDTDDVEYAGRLRTIRGVPVVGTARMGPDGFYEEISSTVGHGDGSVEGYSSDPHAYALRVKGDSMYPAIKDGQFVVIEPGGRCVPGENVMVCLMDGRRMVKELFLDRSGSVTLLSINGGERLTLDRKEIDQMYPVAAVIAASKWRPE